jgi:hypothetical protein
VPGGKRPSSKSAGCDVESPENEIAWVATEVGGATKETRVPHPKQYWLLSGIAVVQREQFKDLEYKEKRALVILYFGTHNSISTLSL